MEQNLAGIGKKQRSQLSTLLKLNKTILTPQDTGVALGIDNSRAAQLLSLWYKKGWLSRVKRGVYIPVSFQAEDPAVMADEPWTLAKALFDPCYIGGWSSAEHWDFTEQIFTSTMVFTPRKMARREQKLQGATFIIKTIKAERFFGTTEVWLQNQKVKIADPAKTIVDAFNDPNVVGGMRMALDILERYLKSEHKNLDLILQYAERMRNTAIFKRLGFVFASKHPNEKDFIRSCQSRLKAGYSQLDPANPGTKLVTAWKLWIPSSWKEGAHDHA